MLGPALEWVDTGATRDHSAVCAVIKYAVTALDDPVIETPGNHMVRKYHAIITHAFVKLLLPRTTILSIPVTQRKRHASDIQPRRQRGRLPEVMASPSIAAFLLSPTRAR